MLASIHGNKRKFGLVGVLLVAILLWAGSPAALAATANAPRTDYTFEVNSGGDTHDAVPGNHICADSAGNCTLRAAIEEAFSTSGNTTVNVNVPTVTLSGSLGTINWVASNTRVNGNLAVITGVNMTGSQDIISISGNDNTLDDVVIQRSRQDGVRIGDFAGTGTGNNNTVSNSIIIGNGRFGVYIAGGSGGGGQNNRLTTSYVGITRTGATCVTADANPYDVFVTAGAQGTNIDYNTVACSVIDGISVTGGGTSNTIVSHNQVGVKGSAAIGNGFDGITTYAGAANTNINYNTVSGNHEYGVYVSDAATQNVALVNNSIGLSVDGTTNVPNAQGVVLRNTSSHILSTNVIKGNTGPGVRISGGSNNAVLANQIKENGTYGVQLDAGTTLDIIGGTATGYGNTISGNGTASISSGLYIAGSTTSGNFIYGNKIGTTSDGTGLYRNSGFGVELTDGTHDNHIGSLNYPTVHNILSGNVGSGVGMHAGANNNHVENNYIGTNSAGTTALNNEGGGVYLNAVSDTQIMGNLVSGNGDPSIGGNGIEAQNAPRTVIQGNLVGTNAAGIAAMPNMGAGVVLSYGSAGSIISGSGAGQGNTVSGNRQSGIYLYHTDQVVINQGTLIGVGSDNATLLGNGDAGIKIDGSTNTNVRAAKVDNNGAGIVLEGDNSTINNSLLPSEVRNNGGIPIDLNDDGPTVNDPGDADSGPNTLLNYPVITGISGSILSGTACNGCEVYIYEAIGDPRAAGGGGVLRHTTLADGTGDWSTTLPSGLTRYNVTLVACDGPCQSLVGNTSEMSPLDAPACAIQFSDVPAGSTFYPFVRCLACRNIIGGYPCGGAGEPCNSGNDPYFRPGSSITRGQLSKIVSNSAGFSEPHTTQTYSDVPLDSPFYIWIERLSSRGVMGGYPCGGAGEPCDDQNRPYFRPGANVTRGQTSKIVSNADNDNTVIPTTQQTYTDVEVGSPFWVFIERLSQRSIMGGYPCGGVGEPCDAENRPYFRPGANVTRGQASKIDANTFFPGCQTP